jgi:hypothetical protein
MPPPVVSSRRRVRLDPAPGIDREALAVEWPPLGLGLRALEMALNLHYPANHRPIEQL